MKSMVRKGFTRSVVTLGAWGAATLLAGFVGFVSPLVATPATAAASGACSAAIAGPGGAILGWTWSPPANGVPGEVAFTSVGGGVFSIGPYPASVNKVDQNWKTVDDTAPLLWGYKSGVTGIVGDINELFTACQQWSPQAVATMNAQGFAPSMIGGVNPPGITASVQTTPQPTQTSTSQPNTGPAPFSGQTVNTGGVTSTPKASNGTGTPQPQEPPHVTSPPKGAWQHAQQVLKQDRETLIAAAPSKVAPKEPLWRLVAILAAVIAVALATMFLVRRRRRARMYRI